MKRILLAFILIVGLLASCAAPSALPEAPTPPPVPVPQPDVILFISDTHFSNVSLKPIFKWGAVREATNYEFILAKDGAFKDVVISQTGANALETTLYMCPTELDYSTTYYWKVRAINPTGFGEWSGGIFTTISGPEVPVTVPSLPRIVPAPPGIASLSPAIPESFEISESLDAYRVEKGMVLDKDFTISEDYYNNFVKVKWCKQIIITPEGMIYPTFGRRDDPYFIAVCYPTTDVHSDTVGICFKRDPVFDTDTVIAFFVFDTMEAVEWFGGTPGTKEQGWR